MKSLLKLYLFILSFYAFVAGMPWLTVPPTPSLPNSKRFNFDLMEFLKS